MIKQRVPEILPDGGPDRFGEHVPERVDGLNRTVEAKMEVIAPTDAELVSLANSINPDRQRLKYALDHSLTSGAVDAHAAELEQRFVQNAPGTTQNLIDTVGTEGAAAETALMQYPNLLAA